MWHYTSKTKPITAGWENIFVVEEEEKLKATKSPYTYIIFYFHCICPFHLNFELNLIIELEFNNIIMYKYNFSGKRSYLSTLSTKYLMLYVTYERFCSQNMPNGISHLHGSVSVFQPTVLLYFLFSALSQSWSILK